MKTRILRMLIRTVFWPGLFYTRLLISLRIIRAYDEFAPGCYVGSFPTTRDLHRLRARGVRGLINLCEEHRGRRNTLAALEIEQVWLPTLDFHPPTPDDVRRALEFIATQRAAGHGVFIHCKAGRFRSPLVALAWLMRSEGISAEQAEARIRRFRAHVDRRLASVAMSLCLVRSAG